ncbi:OLC1v1019268C1 [Oldenlandia corymbosa var. corymbosa]|uniref:OLC1v1019268C1 n=2 Tax=Oldenlandia corymbosa var. corymbosa TaxID=529605 RepID=A0AAV1EDL0_OLDCO|nr:OLC1v1019268C1 [Oldenlandia corymbosa var. corymbosa]
MESQLHRPAEQHTYDADPHAVGLHSVVEDEGDQQHHEKKSVLKKVKDKAKKIKDKLTHGHEQEHGQVQERDYQHDEYEEAEEGDDEEMVQDPEIHGAPMYESAAIKNAMPAPSRPPNLENPSSVKEDRYDHDPNRSDPIEGKNVEFGQERPKLGTVLAGGLREDPHAPKSHPGEDVPSPNYETKVTDPSGKGGEEIDVNPLVSKFDKMGVSEEKNTGTESEQGKYAGSHDQLLPQSTPTEREFSPTGKSTSDQTSTGGGYVEKISVATSVLADKAISAKNVVASKLGYGGAEENRGQTEQQSSTGQTGAPAPAGSPTGYVQKAAATVSEKLAPVYGKVAGAGSAVVSKVKGTGASGQGQEGTDKGVSVTEFLAEKLKPGEEDKALSEVISDTLHRKKEGLTESKPVLGKVTESEEVRRNLGSGMENKREGEDAIAAGKESVGTGGGGVMDKITGAVTSWITKGNEQEYTKGAADSSYSN